jgi:hypothetical protein
MAGRVIKKKNLRCLASLSALGAGALGMAGSAGAGTPDANGIVWSGILEDKVGFAAGYGAMATIAGPKGAAGILMDSGFRCSSSICNATIHYVNARVRVGPQGTSFRVGICCAFSSVKAVPRGAKFGSTYSVGLAKLAFSAKGESGGTNRSTDFNSTDRYFFFRFVGGGLPHAVYGWAEVNVKVPGGFGGPNVILVSYAYDITGRQIPAGYRGLALDGDEAEFERSGLSALSLGAAGVRRWRVARQAQAQGAAGVTPAQ